MSLISHLSPQREPQLLTPVFLIPILSVFPGSSLHHPVQRRQRRGGVHVGVPLPGGEASSAGPLTSWPARMQFHPPPTKETKILSPWSVSPVWLQWRRRRTKIKRGSLSPSGPVVAALSRTLRETRGERPLIGARLEQHASGHLCFTVDSPLVNVDVFACEFAARACSPAPTDIISYLS